MSAAEDDDKPDMFVLAEDHQCVTKSLLETPDGFEVGEAWVCALDENFDVAENLLYLSNEDGPTIFFRPEGVKGLIAALQATSKSIWPQPLKPLCPASASLLTYLNLHDDVTPIKAREELGIEHLPRRIKDLKEHGHTIRTEIKRGFAGKRYAHYVLVKPKLMGNRADTIIVDDPAAHEDAVNRSPYAHFILSNKLMRGTPT